MTAAQPSQSTGTAAAAAAWALADRSGPRVRSTPLGEPAQGEQAKRAAGEARVVEDRSGAREGAVKALFKRRDPVRRFEIDYRLEEARAEIDAGEGRRIRLALEGGKERAGDPAAWRCDCPAGAAGHVCLHAALAARGLVDPVEERAAEADEPPDPAFAFPTPVEVSPGLQRAAAAARASVERLEDGSVRVLDAKVRRAEAGLECDCPMGTSPACLHRAIADAWARGVRAARDTAAAAGPIAAASASAGAAAVASDERPRRAGEPLPAEDVARFSPLLDRIELFLAELISFGFQRMSAATLERLDGLIVAAKSLGVRDAAPRGAGLGRMVRVLEALRTSLAELRSRLVTTTERDVLRAMGVARNLSRAIRANTGALPLVEYAGSTQQEYEPQAVLDLHGLGLEAWSTPAGFVGVTAYLLDLRTGRILTRGNARPREQVASPDALAHEAAFGGSAVNYLELARGRFLLSGAEVAPDSGRVSSSGKTQLAKRPALTLDDPKLRPALLAGKGDAVRIARRLGFDPLGRPPVSPPVALIEVEQLIPPHFDVAGQRLHGAIVTKGGAVLEIALDYKEDRAVWLDNLEKLAKASKKPRALFVKLSLVHGFVAEPLTAYFESGLPQHLTHKTLEVMG